MDKITILIADDHAVVREGTRQILEQEPDLEVVTEAVDGEEAIKLAGSFRPDIAIIDISMPKVDGIEATKQIKALYPEVAVLILTAYDDDQFVFGLLEAGAAGYLLKSVRGKELVDAVRQVHAGESVLHPTIARKVLNRFVTAPDKSVDRKEKILSERETEVLRLATQGSLAYVPSKPIWDIFSINYRSVQEPKPW
jgi:DNA-binding NarL/FixJ family response regulator